MMQSVREIKYGLKTSDLDRIAMVFAKYPAIKKAVIFGSRAMGNHREFSDIDISLIGPTIDLTLQNKIENELDDLLLPYKFDIIVFEKINNKDLIDHILRVGKEIF